MQAGLTNCIGATGVYIACVPAGPIDTFVGITAVSIDAAGCHWCHFRCALSIRPNECIIGTYTDDGPYR